MIPKSSDSLLCHSIVVEAAAIVSEDGELLFLHHICRRLGLNTTPDIPNVSFKQLSNGWRNLPVLIFFGYLESVCHRQLIRSLTTHVVMRKWSRKGCQDGWMSTQLARRGSGTNTSKGWQVRRARVLYTR